MLQNKRNWTASNLQFFFGFTSGSKIEFLNFKFDIHEQLWGTFAIREAYIYDNFSFSCVVFLNNFGSLRHVICLVLSGPEFSRQRPPLVSWIELYSLVKNAVQKTQELSAGNFLSCSTTKNPRLYLFLGRLLFLKRFVGSSPKNTSIFSYYFFIFFLAAIKKPACCFQALLPETVRRLDGTGLWPSLLAQRLRFGLR